MHEYCGIKKEEQWNRIEAWHVEQRAETWPGETKHMIRVRLKLPFRTKADDIVLILGNDRFLYEGPNPGDQNLNLFIPVRPNSKSSIVYLSAGVLRHSERMVCVFENPDYIDLKDTPEGSEFLLEVLSRPYAKEDGDKETALRMTRVK